MVELEFLAGLEALEIILLDRLEQYILLLRVWLCDRSGESSEFLVVGFGQPREPLDGSFQDDLQHDSPGLLRFGVFGESSEL